MRYLKKLWTRSVSPRIARTPTFGLRLESLEVRAVPAVLIVDDDLTCPGAEYARIQAAVDAAKPGDTIEVCPGTYTEQVVIGHNKNGLTLVSKVEHAAVIKPPAVLVDSGALIHVDGAHLVTIDGFTIQGPHAQLVAGIMVDMNGSATITDNQVLDIRRGATLSGGAES